VNTQLLLFSLINFSIFKRVSTYFIKCNDLIEQLKRAHLENKLDTRIKHFSKYKLLIINEIVYLPIGKQEAKMFFQFIDRRYEKRVLL